jgi:hypothetical protein
MQYCNPIFVFKAYIIIVNGIHIERGSERRKSEHWKVRTSKVFLRMIRTSKDQNVKNQNVEKNVKSVKMTFDVLIFLDAIGIIRTSKVFVHFLAKITFDILIVPMASENIRTSKIEKINYLRCITYGYQGLWGVR